MQPSERARARSSKAKAKPEAERLRKIDLSRQLGINRVTLDKYLTREDAPKPDAHFRFRVEEVVSYVARQRTEDAKVKGKSFYEGELARLKCEDLAEEMRRRRGDYIDRSELERSIPPLIAEIAELMQTWFVRDLPSRYKGKDTVECAAINQEACDAIADRFRKGAAKIAATS